MKVFYLNSAIFSNENDHFDNSLRTESALLRALNRLGRRLGIATLLETRFVASDTAHCAMFWDVISVAARCGAESVELITVGFSQYHAENHLLNGCEVGLGDQSIQITMTSCAPVRAMEAICEEVDRLSAKVLRRVEPSRLANLLSR